LNNKTNYTNISLPDQKNYEYSYGLAFKLASDKLSNVKDIESQCQKSGSVCQISENRQTIDLQYLNRPFRVCLPDITVSMVDSDEKVELRDKILILHYITRAKGTPLSNKLITYQELQEGSTYYPSFFKRAIKPLIDCFGQLPERLLAVSETIGGYKANYGDIAVCIPAFNRTPITLVLWKGDEEFPPNASILFDSTILDYLSVEDVNILCQTIVWGLARSVQTDN
jgi:hypothetical protein